MLVLRGRHPDAWKACMRSFARFILVVGVLLAQPSPAQAGFVDLGNGAVYDSTRDIT